MSLRAVFRCDGDATVGAGHVARCIQLARPLIGTGADVVFAGRFGGTAAALLERAGMPAVTPEQAAAEAPPDVVVADGYGLRDADLAPLRRGVPVLVVAAGEPLALPALALDYHVGDQESRGGLTSGTTLAGPAYAPVAPEYVTARHPRGADRWLVTLGGGSAGAGLIERAVAAAAAVGAREVWAPGAPPGLEVRRDPAPSGLLEPIAWADAAIAAAGVTAYELACAGVPAALVQIASNQAPVIGGLTRAGTAARVAPETLAADVAAALGDAGARRRMASAGPGLVDGYGVFRVRDALLAHLRGDDPPPPLIQRPAREEDARLLHRWRDDPDVRAVSRSKDPVPFDDHVRWLDGVLADPGRTLLVIERAGEPVGTVRFDRRGSEAEISITVGPEARGGGLGRRIIAQTSELELAARPELERIVAVVQPGNPRSAAAFERAGFRLIGSEGEAGTPQTLVLDRPATHTHRSIS